MSPVEGVPEALSAASPEYISVNRPQRPALPPILTHTCGTHSFEHSAAQTNPTQASKRPTMTQPQKRKGDECDDGPAHAHEASPSPPRAAKRPDLGARHPDPVEQEVPHQAPQTIPPPQVPFTHRAAKDLEALNTARQKQRQTSSTRRSPSPTQQRQASPKPPGQQPPPLAPPSPVAVSTRQLVQYASDGGPDLCDLRGVCLPHCSTCGTACVSVAALLICPAAVPPTGNR
jgi:hypothetical protein